jgi:hypothetical protein
MAPPTAIPIIADIDKVVAPTDSGVCIDLPASPWLLPLSRGAILAVYAPQINRMIAKNYLANQYRPCFVEKSN